MGADRVNGSGRSIKRVGDVVFGADEEIARWVRKRIPGFHVQTETRALGVIKGERVVAGVTYDNWNGVHVECCIAAEPGVFWLDRRTLHAIFYYPFHTLGCEAISVSVPSTNPQSLNLAAKLGFEPEALIKFAATDGSTLVILKQFRDRCKWIRFNGQEEQRRASTA
jgi:hypothetical protein